MNETIQVIKNRRSIRAYEDRPIDRELVDLIIQTAMRAPTAGNMMLYSIIEVQDQTKKDQLAVSCDNQPFIARAPLVLLFLADYQRWFDLFLASDVKTYCEMEGAELRYPGEGDLFLACCDALIAAHTAAIAAESLGIGSCYIGDIMERYEFHQELFGLPRYTFPIALLCLGYPKTTGASRKLTSRFPQETIHFVDSYQRIKAEDLLELVESRTPQRLPDRIQNMGQLVYARKFSADFSVEMTRSVRKAIENWVARNQAR